MIKELLKQNLLYSIKQRKTTLSNHFGFSVNMLSKTCREKLKKREVISLLPFHAISRVCLELVSL
jgi:hypothetical protein